MTEERVHIEICVCTFRRPILRQTLDSLARQELPEGVTISVLVIDNDVSPSARTVVERAEHDVVPMRYVHCPGANISIARNGALDHAQGRFLAFIDDDEVASPNWIAALWTEMRRSGAQAVLGPVDAVYGDDAPQWMRRSAIHSTRPVWVDGKIRTGYTCNALLDRDWPAIRDLRFEPGLGRTGGEDTAYFTSIAKAGGDIVYAEDALVREDVPSERQKVGWLLRRRYRMGQTHGRLKRRSGTLLKLPADIGLAGVKLLYCLAAAGFGAYDATRRNQAMLRGVLHAGVIAGLAGARELELYGAEPAGKQV
ncbi:glycosyltransferase family 2 protein [Qingshengfaniella alkalisoli]|uniref:Glycosyltransferase n=1 Tax=Qingshengfaniella alkalisoli TaxID=2599296 RepID=A0A5B8J156_9RHOB|nr:glycosyltransferase family 2 protein [Qingshengfaniella alkalisoli]QDY71624.1 glycosyltransferase [Qingshengfaniella alkalisoli]